MDKEKEFKDKMKSYGRKDMLRLLRAWGFTAYKVKTDDELADLLWKLKNRK
jgi:hypothetical protein